MCVSARELHSRGKCLSLSLFFSLVILSSLIKAKFSLSGSQNFFAQLKIKSNELLFMYIVASGGPVRV